MFENWYTDLRVVETLHGELLRAAAMRRLARTQQSVFVKGRRLSRRLAVMLAVLGMR